MYHSYLVYFVSFFLCVGHVLLIQLDNVNVLLQYYHTSHATVLTVCTKFATRNVPTLSCFLSSQKFLVKMSINKSYLLVLLLTILFTSCNSNCPTTTIAAYHSCSKLYSMLEAALLENQVNLFQLPKLPLVSPLLVKYPLQWHIEREGSIMSPVGVINCETI